MIQTYIAFVDFKGDRINSKTAILIFARGANIEALHKRFHSSVNHCENQKLAKILNINTIDTCEKTKLPYFFFDHKCQKGSTFENRLSHAFQEIFNKGFENVIAVGNDCPELQYSDIIEANLSLIEGKTVLGPSNDGGVYLIGISKKVFGQGVLTAIRWKTSVVFKELIRSINGPIKRLIEKFDIDHPITKRTVNHHGSILLRLWAMITFILDIPRLRHPLMLTPIPLRRTISHRGPPFTY